MSQPAIRSASYEDLRALPDNVIGEIIDGELVTQPRPSAPHALAASALNGELYQPFQRGKQGPGGWIILHEPELHLSADILVPDLAGWRRERLPEVPDAPALELAPDWACEVLSTSTEGTDRARKMPIYAREGVRHVWLIGCNSQTIEVYRLDGDTYRLVRTHQGSGPSRLEPFDAVEFDVGVLWRR